MALGFQVNGEAKIQTGTGTSQALEDLGVATPDGVRIRPRIHRRPIFVDTTGPDVPFDHQYMGEDGFVVAQLVYFDQAVMSKIQAVKIDGTPGTLIETGTVLGGLTGNSSAYHRLAVLSPGASRPYDFAKAFLMGEPLEIRLSTQVTIYQVTWYYFNPQTASGGTSGDVVYDNNTA